MSSKSEKTPWFDFTLLLVLLVAFVPLVFRSLWLDEFATFFATEKSFWGAVTLRWQEFFVSPIFFGAAWISAGLIGSSEWSLRVPTLIFALFACRALYKFISKRFGDESARYALILLLTFPAIWDQFSYARPYALGLWLSILGLDFWEHSLKTGERRGGIIAVVCCVAAIYSHLTFVPLILVYALFWLKFIPLQRNPLRSAGVLAFAGVLLAPLAALSYGLWSGRNHFNLVETNPDLFLTLITFISPTGLVSVIGIAILSWRFGLTDSGHAQLKSQHIRLLALWMGLPWLVTLLAVAAGAHLTASRYNMLALPPLAGLLAVSIAALNSTFAKRLVLSAALITGLVSNVAMKGQLHEDWRSAASLVKKTIAEKNAVLLFYPGWPETNRIDRISNAHADSGMLTPLRYYQIDSNPIFIPYRTDSDSAQKYLQTFLAPYAGEKRVFVLLSCFPIDPLIPSMAKIVFPSGWKANQLGRFGQVSVVLLESNNL